MARLVNIILVPPSSEKYQAAIREAYTIGMPHSKQVEGFKRSPLLEQIAEQDDTHINGQNMDQQTHD